MSSSSSAGLQSDCQIQKGYGGIIRIILKSVPTGGLSGMQFRFVMAEDSDLLDAGTVLLTLTNTRFTIVDNLLGPIDIQFNDTDTVSLSYGDKFYVVDVVSPSNKKDIVSWGTISLLPRAP